MLLHTDSWIELRIKDINQNIDYHKEKRHH